MRSSNFNTLAVCAVLFLTVGVLSGCADEPEETVNQSEGMAVAPMPSEEIVEESITAIEDDDFGFGGIEDMDEMEGLDPFGDVDTASDFDESEPLTGMLDSMIDGADDAVDGTVDSVNDATEAFGGVVEDSIDVTQDTVDEMTDFSTSSIIEEETQLSESVMVDEGMTEVVTATPDIIRNVQQALENAGFNPGPVDGISGPRTLSALETFQQQNNISSGEFTKETLRALGVDY